MLFSWVGEFDEQLFPKEKTKQNNTNDVESRHVTLEDVSTFQLR